MFTVLFRRTGRRGALIAGLVTLALVVGLVVGLVFGLVVGLPGRGVSSVRAPSASPSLSPAPSQPSPSNAIVGVTSFKGSDTTVGSQDPTIVTAGVSARTGATIWSATTIQGAIFVASADGVYYTSDIITSGINEGRPEFTAYRMSDGARLWSIPSPVSSALQPPLLITHGLLIFSAMASPESPPGAIYALDLTKHTFAWSANVPDGVSTYTGYRTVAANASMLFVGSFPSGLNLELDMTALRLRDGSIAWRKQVASHVTAVGIEHGGGYRWISADAGAAYIADAVGVVTALRPSDGAVVWRSQPVTSVESGMRLTSSSSTLYECAPGGAVGGVRQGTLLALDPATGHERWRAAVASCQGRLIESGGTLYSAEQDLVARRASDGVVLWRVSPLKRDMGFLSLRVDAGVVIAAASVALDCPTGSQPPSFTRCQDPGYVAAFNGASGAPYWRVSVYNNPYLIDDGWLTNNFPVAITVSG